MTSHVTGRANSLLDDYMTMRTLPAMLSVAFVLASLYQFGGIGTVSLDWLNYTLAAEESVMISMGAFAAAFASSETKRFENYEEWEMAVIAAGPAVILGQHYVTAVDDFLLQIGDPLGYQVAFIVTVAAWGVATQ